MCAGFAGWWDTGSGAKRGEASLSKELILAEMHPLDDVSAVVKDTADVLRVDGARKVWVAIVLPISGCRRNAEKLVPDKVLGPHHLFIYKIPNQDFLRKIKRIRTNLCIFSRFCCRIRWRYITGEIGEIFI